MPTMQLQTIGSVVREYEPADRDEIFQIDRKAFSPGQSDEWLFDRSHRILVLERSELIRGFCVFNMLPQSVGILRIAVDVARCGFGTKLLQEIRRRAITEGKLVIETVVDEYAVGAQNWFAHRKFECVDIVKGDGRSGYVFRSCWGLV